MGDDAGGITKPCGKGFGIVELSEVVRDHAAIRAERHIPDANLLESRKRACKTES